MGDPVPDPATEFFDLVVELALAEYLEAEKELTRAVQGEGDVDAARALTLRRARTASIELHQFTDRVLAANPGWAQGDTLGKLRTWLADSHMARINGKATDDLAILHDVADAFKHADLGHPRPGRDWFVKSDAAVVRTGTGYGRLEYGEGKYGGVEQTVIELRDGRERTLSLVLMLVRDAWASAMGRERMLPRWGN